ncbi:MAG: DDE-type integrase/transposase/recombinase [Bdellovibrionales bacterium]
MLIFLYLHYALWRNEKVNFSALLPPGTNIKTYLIGEGLHHINTKDPPPKGYKAKNPNEAWHIDVSEIKISESQKYYFQAVLDNYSRCILAWIITDNISAKNTLKVLKGAQEFSQCLEVDTHSKVITDAGSENTAKIVNKYIYGENLTHLVARRDVVFSNSMIEVFFRSLKHHFLFNQKIKSQEHLVKKVKFYVDQHNKAIPKPFLKGATPLEAYTCAWGDENIKKLEILKAINLEKRKSDSSTPTCNVCSD